MTDKELMQQALEALEFYYDQHGEESDARVIAALRDRLAQPYCDDCGGTDPECPLAQPEQWEQLYPDIGNPFKRPATREEKIVRPGVYEVTGPMHVVCKCDKCKAQPEQEPVALQTVYETIIKWDEGGGKRSRRELARRIIALYTTPPRREWVGLTDEEIEQVCVPLGAAMLSFPEVARAIEAKLKEKNA